MTNTEHLPTIKFYWYSANFLCGFTGGCFLVWENVYLIFCNRPLTRNFALGTSINNVCFRSIWSRSCLFFRTFFNPIWLNYFSYLRRLKIQPFITQSIQSYFSKTFINDIRRNVLSKYEILNRTPFQPVFRFPFETSIFSNKAEKLHCSFRYKANVQLYILDFSVLFKRQFTSHTSASIASAQKTLRFHQRTYIILRICIAT